MLTQPLLGAGAAPALSPLFWVFLGVTREGSGVWVTWIPVSLTSASPESAGNRLGGSRGLRGKHLCPPDLCSTRQPLGAAETGTRSLSYPGCDTVTGHPCRMAPLDFASPSSTEGTSGCCRHEDVTVSQLSPSRTASAGT